MAAAARLPKFNATDMLERSWNGRIVFVGDSIGRNQWESMLCMLAAAVPAGSRIYEQFGKPLSRHKGYLSMVFADYNLSVEYYRAPLLVMVDRLPSASNGAVRRAIRLDMLPRHAARWAGADVLILNTGHWWNLHKTIKSLTTTGGNGAPPQSRSQVATHLLKELKEGLKVSGGGLLEAGNRHPDRQSASCGESATFLAYNINPGRVSSIIWPCSHEQSSACYRN